MAAAEDGQSDVVWPGYVAAMASLLLSLLLVCAVLVMTIGQIGSISESYLEAIAKMGFKDAEEVDDISRLAGITDVDRPDPAKQDPDKLDPESAGGQEAKEIRAAFQTMQFGRLAGFGQPQRVVLDLDRAQFDAAAARQAAAFAAKDKELLKQVDLSKLDLRKIRFVGLDPKSVDLNRPLTAKDLARIDFSQVNFGRLSQARIAALKPIVAREAIRYQLRNPQAQVADAGPRTPEPAPPKVVPAPVVVAEAAPPPPRPAPPAPPPPPLAVPAPAPVPAAPTYVPDRFLITFVEDAMEPSSQQKQQVIQIFEDLRKHDSGIRLWIESPSDNDQYQRVAYARLVALRAWAVEAGIPAARIAMSMEKGSPSATSTREISVHVALQRR